LVIAVAGALDHDNIVHLVETNLEAAGWNLAIADQPKPRRINRQAEIKRGAELKIIPEENAQANILLGMQGLIANDDQRYAMAVLNTVLGGGMSSRLFQEIREKRGLAYSTYSFNQGYSDGAVFGMYAGCSPAKAGEVAKLMLAELEKIANAGITPGELELAYGNVSGGLALKFESTQARMSRLSAVELGTGEFIDLDTALSRFKAVTADDVKALASNLLGRDRSLVAVGPVDEVAFRGLV
jgi:predicted Zn-dependent peptidase